MRSYRFPAIEVEYIQPEHPSAAPGAKSTVTCRWALVFNIPRYAVDLEVEPDACEQDGVLDLCSLEYGSVFSGTRYLGGIVTKRHIRWKDVVRRQIAGCRITSTERVAFQVDGDYAGRLPLEIGVLPGRIRLQVAEGTTASPLRPSLSILGNR